MFSLGAAAVFLGGILNRASGFSTLAVGNEEPTLYAIVAIRRHVGVDWRAGSRRRWIMAENVKILCVDCSKTLP